MKSLSNLFTLILSSVGALIALALTVEHFLPNSVALPCGVGGGCQAAMGSQYGSVGPIPTAAFGLGMYLILMGFCWKRRQRLAALRAAEAKRAADYAVSGAESEAAGTPAPVSPALDPTATLRTELTGLDMSVWVLALLGVFISWWLQYTSLYTLKSFCPYCFSSAAIITLIFLLASRDYLLDGRTLNSEQKMFAGVLGFIIVMLGFIFVPNIVYQIGLIKWNDRQNSQPLPPNVDPSLVIKPDMHILGDKNAPYTIVEFADYQCPACKQAVKMVPDIVKKYPNIKIAFRNFPLQSHAHSKQAAEAAEAAGLQGKFWQMHDLIYDRQEAMEGPTFMPETFSTWAGEIPGLNVQKFDQDRADPKIEASVDADQKAGVAAGVIMTPSFIFVGKHGLWRFSGTKELLPALANPKHDIWK